ncbi:larval/pupal cuticle protein H1C-like [Zophobas morio]|uniref:larval/pupal cuticle protein H1C-like n=1 Tax=Zophobas morio TaxID=2755281 RepID=UPI003082AD17
MFKLVVLAMLVCAASAGIIAGGLGHGAVVAAPAVAVAHAPLASSYQNSNQISLHPTAVVATHAVAAPVAVAHAGPVAVAHAPVALGAVGIGLGHGLLH